MTKAYELMYILPSTLTEEEAGAKAITVSEVLKKHQGSVTHELDLGKKKLAYPINHDRYGYYRLVDFTAEAQVLNLIERDLQLSRELLRHMITVKPVKSEAQREKERALKEKLAARRQRDEMGATTKTAATGVPATPMTTEEMDKKIEKILEEEPVV